MGIFFYHWKLLELKFIKRLIDLDLAWKLCGAPCQWMEVGFSRCGHQVLSTTIIWTCLFQVGYWLCNMKNLWSCENLGTRQISKDTLGCVATGEEYDEFVSSFFNHSLWQNYSRMIITKVVEVIPHYSQSAVWMLNLLHVSTCLSDWLWFHVKL